MCNLRYRYCFWNISMCIVLLKMFWILYFVLCMSLIASSHFWQAGKMEYAILYRLIPYSSPLFAFMADFLKKDAVLCLCFRCETWVFLWFCFAFPSLFAIKSASFHNNYYYYHSQRIHMNVQFIRMNQNNFFVLESWLIAIYCYAQYNSHLVYLISAMPHSHTNRLSW